MFVLVDGDRRPASSASARSRRRSACSEPWYNYHVGTLVHASRDARRLHGGADAVPRQRPHRATPSSARCSSTRRTGTASNGALLVEEPAAVHRRIRRPLRAEGHRRAARPARAPTARSPFWEGLGRHFFAMEYSTADYLTGIGQKSFIAELMPRHPVYVNLLPRGRARRRSAKCTTTPRRRARCSSRKAFATKATSTSSTPGPTVECFRDNIDAVRRSSVLPVDDRRGAIRCRTASPTTSCGWSSNRRFDDFRALRRGGAGARRPLSAAAVRGGALGVGEGDTVRAVPLRRATDERAPRSTRARPSPSTSTAFPGPTHNYAGLARGNLAAERNAQLVANPRAGGAAGTRQDARARRARLSRRRCCRRTSGRSCRRCARSGFGGSDARSHRARRRATRRACSSACSSAAAMWVANAATVSPSADTADGRVHFTPANLVVALPPRARGAGDDARAARDLRRRRRTSRVHDPLPAAPQFGDEGAANHTRFARRRRARRRVLRLRPRRRSAAAPRRRALSRAADARGVARRSRGGTASIRRARVFAQQNPGRDRRRRLPQRRDRRRRAARCCSATSARSSTRPACSTRLRDRVGPAFEAIVVRDARAVSVADAVATYLFNSQLLARADGRFLLVAPAECRRAPRGARAYSTACSRSGGPIAEVLTFDLRQSMRNGGGPACLRLRVRADAPPSARRSARACSSTTRWPTSSTRWIRRALSRPARAGGPRRSGAARRVAPRARRADATPRGCRRVYDFQRAGS